MKKIKLDKMKEVLQEIIKIANRSYKMLQINIAKNPKYLYNVVI